MADAAAAPAGAEGVPPAAAGNAAVAGAAAAGAGIIGQPAAAAAAAAGKAKHGNKPRSLHQDNATRWNGIISMLVSLVQLRVYLVSFFTLDIEGTDAEAARKRALVFTDREWKAVAELCAVLETFREITNLHQYQSQGTAAFSYPLFRWLRRRLTFDQVPYCVTGLKGVTKSVKLSEMEPEVTKLVANFLVELDTRLFDNEDYPPMADLIAHYLHPGFRGKYMSVSDRERAEKQLNTFLEGDYKRFAPQDDEDGDADGGGEDQGQEGAQVRDRVDLCRVRREGAGYPPSLCPHPTPPLASRVCVCVCASLCVILCSCF